jgi:NADPH:quinone reductase-like Zn-dependent oxidoreductase
MKAVALHAFGGPEALTVTDLPRPKTERGELLLRTLAAGVNPVDWKIAEGRMSRVPHAFPLIPGWDVAGVVEEIGEGCQRFRKGDRVFAYARKPFIQWGAYAEYVAVAERHVALMPPSLLFEEAAAIPCAALTAQQALARAGLGAGAVLLVLNGSGGVGHFALQLAKIAGARSIATTGSLNQEFVMSQGAEAAIDYTRDDLAGAVSARYKDGVDVVLDAIGGEPLAASLEVVKRGGVIVSVVDTIDPEAAKTRGIRFERITSEPSGEQLAIFAAHAGRKKLRPHVRTILPLAEASRALIESRGGHVRGKLVLAL